MMFSSLSLPHLPEIFAAGTLMIDGQSVALPRMMTVRQLVAQRPRRARVFEKYGISYCCCSGNQTFLEACAEKGADPCQVLADLRENDSQRNSSNATEFDSEQLPSPIWLQTNIIEAHHGFLRTELPRLSYLIDKVANRHGELYNELWELQGIFEELKEDIEEYLDYEVNHLFPLLNRFGAADESVSELQNIVDRELCEIEGRQAYFCQSIAHINSLTSGFQVPETACNTLRVMLQSFSELTHNMNRYIQKEHQLMLAYCK